MIISEFIELLKRTLEEALGIICQVDYEEKDYEIRIKIEAKYLVPNGERCSLNMSIRYETVGTNDSSYNIIERILENAINYRVKWLVQNLEQAKDLLGMNKSKEWILMEYNEMLEDMVEMGIGSTSTLLKKWVY